uniref:Uncharacterized protein n=1 Tax=Tetraselmis sp. GSL018 TaxID=582737 RepID=A0A061SH86_9CHLO
MTRLYGGGRKLEAFKFFCYLSIPIVMTWAVAGSPTNLEAIIKNRSYVVYPPAGPKPPTIEELHDFNRSTK